MTWIAIPAGSRFGDSSSRVSCVRGCHRHHVVRDVFKKWERRSGECSPYGNLVSDLRALCGRPLFLYDRTAANESGPLLQLDRTPEVRISARTFSVSSMIWLAAGVIYLLYVAIKVWRSGR